MAITKIHPITNTVNRAIDYISVPHKTSGACMISYYGCGKDDAAISFRHADLLANRKSDYKAYHLIQSFAPFEVDEDTAHLIGKKLADKVLGGKYYYVIATHNDRNHIHNHIIFCSTSTIDHKRYHSSPKSYYRIRDISDSLCLEYGLSLADEPKKAIKYSLKGQLKKDIRECSKLCPSLSIFISRMEKKGYKIRNDSSSYIAFLPPGKEKWIRGKASTLGERYTREGIISSINKSFNSSKGRAIDDEMKSSYSYRDFISIDNLSDDKKHLKIWQEKENFKRLCHNYTLLHENGLNSGLEIDNSIEEKIDDISLFKEKIVGIDSELLTLRSTISLMEKYISLKKYNDLYRSSKDKEKAFERYEDKLLIFFNARKELKDKGYILKNINEDLISDLKDKIDILTKEKDDINNNIYSLTKEITLLKDTKDKLYQIDNSSTNDLSTSIDKKDRENDKHLD